MGLYIIMNISPTTTRHHYHHYPFLTLRGTKLISDRNSWGSAVQTSLVLVSILIFITEHTCHNVGMVIVVVVVVAVVVEVVVVVVIVAVISNKKRQFSSGDSQMESEHNHHHHLRLLLLPLSTYRRRHHLIPSGSSKHIFVWPSGVGRVNRRELHILIYYHLLREAPLLGIDAVSP